MIELGELPEACRPFVARMREIRPRLGMYIAKSLFPSLCA